MTTTNNGSDLQHLKEQKTTSSKVNNTMNGTNEPSTVPNGEPTAATTTNSQEATTKPKPSDSTLEQEFFFGLTIDDAVNSADNLMELFYNACKYSHLELVRRCVEQKHIDVNEPINNDYPLCIAW